ncbi:MAG: hypothetical protein GY757_25485 [bacterium]|nr:hypothetical protein [bacterium]
MKTCSINPVAKYIRIILSLLIIGLGIYFRNWVGILGFYTLYTAIKGKCGTSITLGSRKIPPPQVNMPETK